MMWQELIVTLACIQGPGCSQAQSAYYSTHPELRQIIRSKSNQAKQMVGPAAIYVSPIYILQISRQATFHISKHLNLQLQFKNERTISLQFTF